MPARMDRLLEQIDRTLIGCDARWLPPLTSGPAAAVFDLAEQAGLQLTPWQEQMVRAMYAETDRGTWLFVVSRQWGRGGLLREVW